MVNNNVDIRNTNTGKSVHQIGLQDQGIANQSAGREVESTLNVGCERGLVTTGSQRICSTHAEGAPSLSELAASSPTVIFHLPISSLKHWLHKRCYVEDAHNTFLDTEKQEVKK